jgi:hypothetical protein
MDRSPGQNPETDEGSLDVSTPEAIAALIAIAMVSLCVLVRICLAGTQPHQRPAILRALAEVLRSTWPAVWHGAPRLRSSIADQEPLPPPRRHRRNRR